MIKREGYRGVFLLLLATIFLKADLTAQTITSVQNPASNILAGLPNYGIAEGSIFVLYGSGLGPATIAQAATLPFGTSLAGTSIKVTAGGQTYSPFMLYTLNSQVAAVMPSSVPAGSATIQVTYNSTTGLAFNTTIVASNFGISTVNQTGSGPAVITTGSYGLVTSTNSAVPGSTYTMWGTGLGPDAASDNNVAPGAISTPIKVWVGGLQANVSYGGRSSGVGLDQINFTIPAGLSGCNVSLVVQTNALVSNTTTLPIASNGGPCSDPANPFSTAISTALANGSVAFGGVAFAQENLSLTDTGYLAAGSFVSYTPTQYSYLNPLTTASYGSCTVTTATVAGDAAAGVTGTGLDAGAITVTPPSGSSFNLTENPKGTYSGAPSALPAGTYTVTGSGGANVGPFTARLAIPTPLTWTNQSAVTGGTIVRSQGQQITWSGGDPNSYATITGDAIVASGTTAIIVSFSCVAPASAGQFTIPAVVLLAMPSVGGFLGVGSTTNIVQFSASGLNVGYLYAFNGGSVSSVTYQ